MPRPAPSWLIDDDYVDDELGTLKTGKEAEIRLVERTARDASARHLLVEKRYRPKTVSHKGELEALGLTRAATFRNDIAYREARTFRDSRDRHTIAKMSRYGKSLVRADWVGHEHDVLLALWEVGVPVPYPVSTDRDSQLLMQYLGDDAGAAPRLAQARLDRRRLDRAWHQLLDALRAIVAAGWVHADLSAYNLLWWDDQIWVIDVPQAVDLLGSTNGYDLLHRDVVNVCGWFASKGVTDAEDPDAVFAAVL